MKTKLDLKSITIIVLGVLLILSFIFRGKTDVNKHTDDIGVLHKNNIELLKRNDSLIKVNTIIDLDIKKIDKELGEKAKSLAESQIQINKLKNKKHENNNYVKHLSANDVSIALSNYLENRAKSSDNR